MTDESGGISGIDWGGEVHHLCLLDADGQVCGDGGWPIRRRRCTRRCSASARGRARRPRDRRRAWKPHTACSWIHCWSRAFPSSRSIRNSSIGFATGSPSRGPKTIGAMRTGGGFVAHRSPGVSRRPPDDPAILHLREQCRIVEELLVEEGRLVNRLRDQLYRVNAAWLTLSPAADEPWLWTVLGRRRTRSRGRTSRGGAFVGAPRPPHSPRDARRGRHRAAPTALTSRPAWRKPSRCASPSLVPLLLLVACPAPHHRTAIDRSLAALAAPRRPRASRASIVTSRFSSPCQASEDLWPPRCSRKPRAPWPRAIMPRSARTPAPPR